MSSFAAVVDGLAAMEPEPRRERWGGLSSCVIDAVRSIAARYDQVVRPLVRRVAVRATVILIRWLIGSVVLFADDRQIRQVMYRSVLGDGPSYSVQVTILQSVDRLGVL